MSTQKGSKTKYKTVLNELLGVDIDWSKLKLEELIQLANALDHPEQLLEKLGVHKQVAEQKIGRIGMGLLEKWDGPFARLMREFVGETKGDGK